MSAGELLPFCAVDDIDSPGMLPWAASITILTADSRVVSRHVPRDVHISKLIKLYTLNADSFLCVHHTSVTDKMA